MSEQQEPSAIADMLTERGCECAHDAERLEDHTCLAGRAELEWRNLDSERMALRARVAELEKADEERRAREFTWWTPVWRWDVEESDGTKQVTILSEKAVKTWREAKSEVVRLAVRVEP